MKSTLNLRTVLFRIERFSQQPSEENYYMIIVNVSHVFEHICVVIVDG